MGSSWDGQSLTVKQPANSISGEWAEQAGIQQEKEGKDPVLNTPWGTQPMGAIE